MVTSPLTSNRLTEGDPSTPAIDTLYDVQVDSIVPRFAFSIPEPQSRVPSIETMTHPQYDECKLEWEEWRLTYNAGRPFLDAYLKRYSKREKYREFYARKEITTIPAFASAAINDIRNAIYQRMSDISREGGSRTYQEAIRADVDRQGSSMNWFIGNQIIPELLVMGKVGIFVDMPSKITTGRRPYIYRYRCEDILNWSKNINGQLTSVLLRNHIDTLHPIYKIPVGKTYNYQLFYLIPGTGVEVFIFDSTGQQTQSVLLRLPMIPFVLPELSHSLMKNVSRHQIALLNLESSDLAFLLKANHPIYVEQGIVGGSDHLKTEKTDENELEQGEAELGVVHGRRYGRGMDQPDFIHPSTDPLKGSIAKQDKLKDDVRLLVNLALSSIKPGQASAESKAMDQAGLESGLSSIGLELAHAERQIETIWAAYEGVSTDAKISYPERYSLKSDEDRRKEVRELLAIRLPSKTYSQFQLKKAVSILIGDKVPQNILETIFKEIEQSKVLFNNTDELIAHFDSGFVTAQTASEALGYAKEEAPLAQIELGTRLRMQAIAQGGRPTAPSNQQADANVLPNV